MANFGLPSFQDEEGDMTAETATCRWMAPEVSLHLLEQNLTSVELTKIGMTKKCNAYPVFYFGNFFNHYCFIRL